MERNLLVGLVTRAQKGESAAMDELFAAFYNDVYYFALKTVKDSDTACDITQETFLEIINTIGNLKEPAAFVTWMKQITYHQCTRYFRKKQEVLVEEDEDGNTIFDTLADESEGAIPSEVYEKEEFRNTILGIINELTEEQRSAVMMYYFDELSVGQIARIQSTSEGTVKSRLNYARKAIKKSVESYEKKHDVRLHSFSFLPLFLLYFGKEFMPVAKAAEIGAVVSETATAAAAGSAAGAGSAAMAASAEATVASTGIGAKIASLPLVAKIAAGITALAVAVGGGVLLAGGCTHTDNDRNCICDTCGEVTHLLYEHDSFCSNCGLYLGIKDMDGDQRCDTCEEYQCGGNHLNAHSFADGICEFCGIQENPHLDSDDGFCDHCGIPMCAMDLAEHRIPDGMCLCELCGEGSHAEGEKHPFCGGCGERLPLTDQNGDGACDVCGEYSCGGSYHGKSAHEDTNGDKLCDICHKYMCGLVWGLEHNINYDDGIYDGLCDDCGGSPYAMGWAGDEIETHEDGNEDGVCDHCDREMCKAYGSPVFGGVDEDGDEKCDICKYFLCDGHDGFVYHYDFDGDEKCDRCGHYICVHGYLPHTDENKDGRCDNCHASV